MAQLFSQQIRICLVEQSQTLPLTFSGNFVLVGEEAKYLINQLNTPVRISATEDYISIKASGDYSRDLKYKQGKELRIEQHPRNTSGYIKIGKQFKERGPFYLYLTDDGKFQIVVYRNVEKYLEYVVPHEILASKKSDFEAIKAQSVAARTYALSHLKPDENFDVYADVRDQMYVSSEEANELVRLAIEETRGQVLSYDGELIPARFCASLGGVQEKPLYLSSSEAPASFAMTLGDKVLGKLSRHFRWERWFSTTEIFTKLKAWFPDERFEADSLADKMLKLTILERSESGRVQALEIETAHFSKELKLLDIRRFFSQKGRIMPSNLFVLKTENGQLQINGGGNGHGLGMGQWEATELSRDGLNYREILAFFYPKAVLGVLE